MSGKVKMRCAHCGKPFKSANAKQTLCAECEVKERAARAAGKSAAAKPVVATPTPLPKPIIVGAGARILDPTLPEFHEPAPEPVERPRPVERRPEAPRAEAPSAVPYGRATQASVSTATANRPQSAPTAPRKDRPPRGAAIGEKTRPPRPPKAPRAPREPQAPVDLTPDQRETVEARYLELATPVEFDGIRTQIATEFSLPKSAVKKTISELRQRMQMPSWWELQAYKGTESDLDRVRQAYAPHLPLPAVGVHKRIATELGIDHTLVYQAIRRIRAELRLPQYNPPSLHETSAPPRASVAAEAASAESH